MLHGLISLYLPSLPKNLIYMLQSTEYQPRAYLAWFWRTKDFSKVTNRRDLDRTRRAVLLLQLLGAGMALQLISGTAITILGILGVIVGGVQLGIALMISYPVVWAHAIVLPLILARLVIVGPKERRLIAKSHSIFAAHPAVKIAVAGSYGKTTMKELLATVLSEGKKVAATPGNKNVTASHAIFADKLNGDEEVLIIEYGEGRPGDVARYAKTTKPDIGVITGVAPAHLDKYKTVEAAGKDIFSLTQFVKKSNIYVNGESEAALPFITDEENIYSVEGVSGWKVTNIKHNIDGISFVISKSKKQFKLRSGLMGSHQVGPLSCATIIADSLGLSKKQIEQGVARTKAYEHRMSPYSLRGALIIDDTYNGNLEGIKAGLKLLSDMTANRKIYVTPGLVDQGSVNREVHETIGELISKANPDKVVLMRNSVTKWIEEGMIRGGFAGELVVEEDPLKFYTNLDQVVASGDLVLMQNDWTDNYN